MYQFKDGGLKNVWLLNGYTIKSTPYGEGVAIHDLDGLTQAICRALSQKQGQLTGVELRYLRSSGMLMSQPAFGRLMGIDGQSVARWEKSGRVPRWADKLVRLLYAAKSDGNEPICQAVERLQTVDRLIHHKIIIREGKQGWQPEFVVDEAPELTAA